MTVGESIYDVGKRIGAALLTAGYVDDAQRLDRAMNPGPVISSEAIDEFLGGLLCISEDHLQQLPVDLQREHRELINKLRNQLFWGGKN